jgi:hypothetical protein
MRFLIVRTDIRAAADDELAAAWAQGERLRDEQTAPEQRRQTFRADDRDAALILARALSSVGAVRSGRQRVKVLPVGRPDRLPRDYPDDLRPGAHHGRPPGYNGRSGGYPGQPGDRTPPPNHRDPAPTDLRPPPGRLEPEPTNLGQAPRFT